MSAASIRTPESFKVGKHKTKIEKTSATGKVVIGSLKGNIHSLGKDMVGSALRSAGFQVVDLGVNVSPAKFVNSALEEKAQVIAISVSVSETVPFLKDVVDLLSKKKLADRIKIVVGGRAVSQVTCKQYGVYAFARDALDTVRIIKDLLNCWFSKDLV